MGKRLATHMPTIGTGIKHRHVVLLAPSNRESDGMTREVVCESVDGSVGSALVGIAEQEAAAFVLVRAWDSQRQPPLIGEALARLGITSTCMSGGVLVDLSEVGLSILASALFGFDELWVGGDATDWSALDSMPPLTSDCVDLSEDDCTPFKSGLLEAGATLALADGCGLNIVRVLASD